MTANPTPQRRYRRHPARQQYPPPRVPQPAPRSSPAQVPVSPGHRIVRRALLLALTVLALLWALAQAPRLFPFAARHGVHPGLLLLAVLALFVIGGLKQAVLFRATRPAVPPASDDA